METKEPYLAVYDSVEHGVEGKYVVVARGWQVSAEMLESLVPAMRFYRRHRRKIKKLLEQHHN
jgi:hypothetical protein